MNLTTCPSCGATHEKSACPICESFSRIRVKAKERRRDYAIQKFAEKKSKTEHQSKP